MKYKIYDIMTDKVETLTAEQYIEKLEGWCEALGKLLDKAKPLSAGPRKIALAERIQELVDFLPLI